MTVPLDLDGAAAVLTGAGSGIGRATAISLAARGCRVVASDLDAERAEETAALVRALAMGPPESLPVEAWQRVLDLNLMSIARSNLVFLPHLIGQGRGHVVNT